MSRIGSPLLVVAAGRAHTETLDMPIECVRRIEQEASWF